MPLFCLVVGCFNDRKKNPDLCFCQVPKIVTNQGEETKILSTERRTRWLATISRADLTETILEIDRVCGIHFHLGKAAYSWDRFNADWVPTLHLGHNKLKKSCETKEKKQQQQRAQRITKTRKRERECEEQEAMKRKAVKVDEPGEQIKDIYMVNEGQHSGETGDEKKIEPNVESNAST